MSERTTPPRRPVGLRQRHGRRVADQAPPTPRSFGFVTGESGVASDELSDLEAAIAQRDAGDGAVAVAIYENADAAETRKVGDDLSLHPLLIEDLIHAHQRPKIERYDDTLFFVGKNAHYADDREEIDFDEIHVVVQPDAVVVFRHSARDSSPWLLDGMDVGHRSDILGFGAEAVLYAVIDALVDEYVPVAEGLSNDVEEIERQVFSGDPAAPQRIYRLSREVIDFQHAVVPLKDILERLTSGFVKYEVHEDLRAYLLDVADHVARITERVAEIRELLSQILTVNSTLVGNRQNEDMKKISSWAAILFAPTLIGAIYGMNFDDMPELHWAFGYPMALLAMLLFGIVLYLVFKSRKWL